MELRINHNQALLNGKTAFLVQAAVGIWKLVFSFQAPAGLFSEEAQYWLWGKHPDWAYYSKPPLIGWVNWLTSGLFGDHLLIIRGSAAIFGVLAGWGMYQLTMLIYRDRQTAFLASLLMIGLPVFWLGFTFFTTDSLLLAGWIISLYAVYSYVLLPDAPLAPYGIIGSVAVSVLAKPTAVLLIIGLVWVLVNLTTGRKKRNGIGLVLLGAALGVSPVVGWNVAHDWVTVRHVLHLAGVGQTETVSGYGLNLAAAGEFLAGQFAAFSPFIWLLLIGLLVTVKPHTGRVERSLMIPFAGMLVLFALISTQTRVEMNWPGPAYLFFIPVLAHWVSNNGAVWVRRLSVAVFATAGIVMLLLQAYRLPTAVLPVQVDPLIRMVGQKELTTRLLDIVADETDPVVLTDNYHLAAQISFYGWGRLRPYCLNEGRRMNQFDVWQEGVRIPGTAWLVAEEPLPMAKRRQWGGTFKAVIPIRYRGEQITTYYVYGLTTYSVTHPREVVSY